MVRSMRYRWAALAWGLLLLSGCGNAFRSEGQTCNSNGQCPTATENLECFYGTCRQSCRQSADCPSGQRCTCSGGWAPFQAGGKTPSNPFGVCVPGCTSDADCASFQTCRFKTPAEMAAGNANPTTATTDLVCTATTARCQADGFCHPVCTQLGTPNECNGAITGMIDSCLEPFFDGGFAFDGDGGTPLVCTSQNTCGP
jgi:hypothetical protein